MAGTKQDNYLKVQEALYDQELRALEAAGFQAQIESGFDAAGRTLAIVVKPDASSTVGVVVTGELGTLRREFGVTDEDFLVGVHPPENPLRLRWSRAAHISQVVTICREAFDGRTHIGWMGPYGPVPVGLNVDPAPHWQPLFS